MTSIEQQRVSNEFGGHASSTSPPHPRKVHFEESCNEFHGDKHGSPEDCPETWYTPEEYAHFKSDAQRLVRKVLLGNDDEMNSFSAILHDVYKTACEVDSESNCSAAMLSRKEMDRLAGIYMDNLELIGLEYYAVRAITKDVRGRREFLQDIVLDVQEE